MSTAFKDHIPLGSEPEDEEFLTNVGKRNIYRSYTYGSYFLLDKKVVCDECKINLRAVDAYHCMECVDYDV